MRREAASEQEKYLQTSPTSPSILALFFSSPSPHLNSYTLYIASVPKTVNNNLAYTWIAVKIFIKGFYLQMSVYFQMNRSY